VTVHESLRAKPQPDVAYDRSPEPKSLSGRLLQKVAVADTRRVELPPAVLTLAGKHMEPIDRGLRTDSGTIAAPAAATIGSASRHSVTRRGPGPVAASASCGLQ